MEVLARKSVLRLLFLVVAVAVAVAMAPREAVHAVARHLAVGD